MALAQKKSRFPWFFGFLFVVIGGGIGGSWLWWKNMTAPVATEVTQPTQFIVESGMSGEQIGNKLVQQGLIESATAWKLWTKWHTQQDATGGFKAGTYLLSPQATLPEIAQQIWRGEIMQTRFTIPEGWSIQQMGEYFASLGYFRAEEFVSAASKLPYDEYPWLPPDIPHLEGFLYPDTYKISSDRTNNPQAIITAMLDNFENIALPVYQQANTDYTLLEWVTLGSIVEKESVVPQERYLIAGVFTARLQQGMRLESDPTVEYGLGIRQTADQPLTYAQVRTPSPYNTYRNSGLPPTAIASPGLASLKATLNPESTEYLFFVARYDGTHVFSKTLAEHEAATKKIRQERNAQNN
ncbi:MAG TPA: endolytic transglycosylase MltG [Xenococcaceae cyanobacterium]